MDRISFLRARSSPSSQEAHVRDKEINDTVQEILALLVSGKPLDLSSRGSNFHWDRLSRHEKVTMEMILAHPELPWNWRLVQCNPNLTLDFVLAHPEIEWMWETLSAHKSIQFEEHIITHPELPWDWNFVSVNPNVTMEHYTKYPDVNWDLDAMLYCQNERMMNKVYASLTLDQVMGNKDMDWDWMKISRSSPLARFDVVADNPDLPWVYEKLWNNPYFFKPTIKEVREWFSAKIICKWILECYTNPKYPLCKRRLLREYRDINMDIV